MEPTEAGSLLVAAAAGDKAAWQMLVERFSGLVWSITRRLISSGTLVSKHRFPASMWYTGIPIRRAITAA